jgi:hypothetical protein
MKSRFAILILVAVVATSCRSMRGGDRYEYPVPKLSTQKTLKAASLDGRFLILSDDSMWNIDWNDAGRARDWAAGERVNVLATNERSFPYVLIKQSDGERVAARYGKKLD